MDNELRLCQAQGQQLFGVEDYRGAQEHFERALKLSEQLLGDRNATTTTILNFLGTVHYGQGQFDKARKYYERALLIREQVLGLIHPDTATSLNNLGTVLQARGD